MKNTFNLPELVVLMVIFAGLVLHWLKIDPTGICMNLGFGFMGLLGLIEALRVDHKNFRLKGFLVAFPVLMIVLAAKAIIEKESDFSSMAVVLIIYTMLLKKDRSVEPEKRTNE